MGSPPLSLVDGQGRPAFSDAQSEIKKTPSGTQGYLFSSDEPVRDLLPGWQEAEPWVVDRPKVKAKEEVTENDDRTDGEKFLGIKKHWDPRKDPNWVVFGVRRSPSNEEGGDAGGGRAAS